MRAPSSCATFRSRTAYTDLETGVFTQIGTMQAVSETRLLGQNSSSRCVTQRLDGVPVTSVTVTGRCVSDADPVGCERSFRSNQGTSSATVPAKNTGRHQARAIYQYYYTRSWYADGRTWNASSVPLDSSVFLDSHNEFRCPIERNMCDTRFFGDGT